MDLHFATKCFVVFLGPTEARHSRELHRRTVGPAVVRVRRPIRNHLHPDRKGCRDSDDRSPEKGSQSRMLSRKPRTELQVNTLFKFERNTSFH